jgi:hypothetical protein
VVAPARTHDEHHHLRHTLAQPCPSARESRRSLAGASPETRRSTLDPDRGYYGESPARLWRWSGETGDLTTRVGGEGGTG